MLAQLLGQDDELADYKNVNSLVAGIEWSISENILRENQHRSMEERFASENIAKRYIDLINSLL